MVVMEKQHSLTRRNAMGLGLSGGLGLAGLMLPATGYSAQAAGKSLVLVELFTSQGCSSCPAADKVAGLLADDPDTVVVSLNVDYWDYLGWRDTLAKPEYTKRQQDYARSRGDSSVYTPQMVVNGATHVVGSDTRKVKSDIAEGRGKGLSVPLTLEVTQSEIKVDIAATPFEGEATLWLMAVAPSIEVKIERGENSGKSITYHNVVRNMVPATMWKGEAFSGKWMRDAVMTPESKSCIAVLQRERTGPLLGLARA